MSDVVVRETLGGFGGDGKPAAPKPKAMEWDKGEETKARKICRIQN